MSDATQVNIEKDIVLRDILCVCLDQKNLNYRRQQIKGLLLEAFGLAVFSMHYKKMSHLSETSSEEDLPDPDDIKSALESLIKEIEDLY